MKKLFYFMFAAAMMFTACKKDKDDPQPENKTEQTTTDTTQKDESSKLITYKVTFDSDGGSSVAPLTVNGGEKATKPTDPTKDGYVFKGWLNGENEYDFETVVTADLTLKAKWATYPFSVSATKKVVFSPGNLQYHCKYRKWRFAEHQYDIISEEDNNKATDNTYNGWKDFFRWGTWLEGNYVFQQIITLYEWEWDDTKKSAIGAEWETLTKDEWNYLLKERENAADKYGVASVNGVNGIIFLPDEWTLPNGLTFNKGMSSSSDEISCKTINEYSAAQWIEMETNGAVFLPSIKYAEDDSFYSTYWSSTKKGDYYANGFYFSVKTCYIRDNSYIRNRSNVRLVKVVE